MENMGVRWFVLINKASDEQINNSENIFYLTTISTLGKVNVKIILKQKY